jgi:hypothetical protein
MTNILFRSFDSESAIDICTTTKTAGTICPGTGQSTVFTKNHTNFIYCKGMRSQLDPSFDPHVMKVHPQCREKNPDTRLKNVLIPGADILTYGDCLYIHPAYRKSDIRAMMKV